MVVLGAIECSVPQGVWHSFPDEGRVAHILLVFRDMWDFAGIDREIYRMNRESEGDTRGIPYLAKNERDMGHPSFVWEQEVDPRE
jgi:hypothetical protein